MSAHSVLNAKEYAIDHIHQSQSGPRILGNGNKRSRLEKNIQCSSDSTFAHFKCSSKRAETMEYFISHKLTTRIETV